MAAETPTPRLSRNRARRWIAHLWREWAVESRRPITPAPVRPNPSAWSDHHVTVAWLGHATVLINFFGVNIITDPALFPRVGIRVPFLFTIGPKRLTAPALTVTELPRIDLILLSHAHFDHFDRPTLRAIAKSNRPRPMIVVPPRTRDLLRRTGSTNITELRWGQSVSLRTAHGAVRILAQKVQHWGARVQRDTYRGYNAYVIERNDRRILFGGDSAFTNAFTDLRALGGIDLALMAIGAYDPWIRSHATPEQAIQMANDAGAEFIAPIHHQTFRLSAEAFSEPIHRFEGALRNHPARIAFRQIGETFTLPDDCRVLGGDSPVGRDHHF